MRAAGPYGEWLINNARRNILAKYVNVVDDSEVIGQYIYQCNSNHNATGEEAFHNLLDGGPWPKHPIGERLKNEIDDIPITFLYGAKSWLTYSNRYGAIVKEARERSYTHIESVTNAGHQVFSDNADDFNRLVIDACRILKSQVACV